MLAVQLGSVPCLGQSCSPGVLLALLTSSLGRSAWLLASLTSYTEPACFIGEETPSQQETYGA